MLQLRVKDNTVADRYSAVLDKAPAPPAGTAKPSLTYVAGHGVFKAMKGTGCSAGSDTCLLRIRCRLQITSTPSTAGV